MRVWHAGYHEGSVGDYGNALHWYVDPDELAHSGRRLRVRRDGIYSGRLSDTILLGGYRKCSGNSMGAEYHWRPMYRNVVARSEDPNGQPSWNGQGTQWGMRAYGVTGGRFEDCVWRNIFGEGASMRTSGEGHANYLTLSPLPGQRLVYQGCKFENLGGHAMHHTTAWDSPHAINADDRAGNAPQPKLGGRVIIRNTTIHNTNGSPARGSYSLDFQDSWAKHVLRGVTVLEDWSDQGGIYKNDDIVNSRGMLSAKGMMESLEVHRSEFMGVPPVDRTASVSIRGPRTVLLHRSDLDCPLISINYKGHGSSWRGGQPLTEWVNFKDVTGTARVELYPTSGASPVVYQLSAEPQSFELNLGQSEFWSKRDETGG